MPTYQEMLRIRDRYQRQPDKFCKEVLGGRFWDKQVEVLNSVRDNRHTLVKSSHGVGKTHIAARAALWFKLCFRPSKVITLASSWSQVEKQLWGEMRAAHSQAKIPLGGTLNLTEWLCGPNEYAIGVSPDKDVNLQGHHQKNLLVIFDEAAGIRPEFWAAKEGLISAGDVVRFLAIANPTESAGPFFEAWTRSAAHKITMGTFDSPNFKENGLHTLDDLKNANAKDLEALKLPWPELISPVWAKERLEEWGEESPLFIGRVLGEFPPQGDDTLIPLGWLERCARSEPKGKAVAVLGVDVARYGNDKSAIYGFKNGIQTIRKTYSGQSTTQTTGAIVDLVRRGDYSLVVVDDTGVGGGVTDSLIEYTRENKAFPFSVLPVNNGEKPSLGGDELVDDRFQDRGTQVWWNLREQVKECSVKLLDEGALFSQLTSRKFKYTPAGKIRLESKEELRKRGMPSPDEGDACALAVWGMRRAKSASIGVKDLEESLAFGGERASASSPWEG